MIVKTTMKEISPTSTSTKSREYECVITAVGDKNFVTAFENFCSEYARGYADGVRHAQLQIGKERTSLSANPNPWNEGGR